MLTLAIILLTLAAPLFLCGVHAQPSRDVSCIRLATLFAVLGCVLAIVALWPSFVWSFTH